MSKKTLKSVDSEFSKIFGIFDEKFSDAAKFPPIKSFPSFGPTLPLSKPLSRFDGK